MNGVLVIDKPSGFTSFDVIAVIRRITGQRKLGHTGTLDPNATGVLPVLLGTATKAQDIILNHDKSYVADFALGKTTDTLDIWGNVTSENNSQVKREDILKILPEFTGDIKQIPPMYSAVQKNGKRLYELARQGIEIERESRTVTVYSLVLIAFDEDKQCGTLEISCSKGTYVRTIVDDIGRALQVGAVMTALRRTAACGFTLADAVSLDKAKELAENGELERNIRSVEGMFEECGYLCVSDAQAKRFSNGGALDISRTYLAKLDVDDGQIFRVKKHDNTFLGLGIADTEKGLLKIYFQNMRNF